MIALKGPGYVQQPRSARLQSKMDGRSADGRSDMSLSRLIKPLLLSGALLFGAFASRAQAEELRVGFIAPMTGLFAQVGKDMVDGFQMYLDEHGNKLGGMDVKFILEDDQAKPDLGVTKAKKLVNDQVQMFIGGVLASTG